MGVRVPSLRFAKFRLNEVMIDSSGWDHGVPRPLRYKTAGIGQNNSAHLSEDAEETIALYGIPHGLGARCNRELSLAFNFLSTACFARDAEREMSS